MLLCQVIRRYINGHLKKDASPTEDDGLKPNKLKKVYTIRDVIKHKYVDLIKEQIPYKTNEKEYIGCYQRAVTTVQENMSKDDLKELEEIALRWSKEGVPEDVQRK